MLNIIKDVCLNNKDKIFYKNKEESITYGKLYEKANLLAETIPKDYKGPIIVYGNKEVRSLVGFLACLLNGNPYISINDKMPMERVKSIIKESNSSFSFDGNIKISGIPRYKRFSNNDLDYAYIIFTSGSTGKPKGVPITKGNLKNFISWINKVIPKNNVKNIFNQADFSFDLSVADLYFTLTNGYTLYGYDGDLFNVIKNLKENEIDVMVVTPPFIKFCLQEKDFNGDDLPFLKTIFFCGEKLEKKTVIKLKNRFKNINVINAYGPTEATCAVTANLITEKELFYDSLPVGKVLDAATEVEIIDGQIVLKGKSVSNGYINIKTDNFYKEGNINCYKTGDLGYIKDGYLFCTGRCDNQIKYKGYRIEIEEIEEAINSLKEVKDSIVSILKKDDVVRQINAYVVLKDKNIDVNIKELLKDKLPSYMVPKDIKIIDEIPYNNNFKKNRSGINES